MMGFAVIPDHFHHRGGRDLQCAGVRSSPPRTRSGASRWQTVQRVIVLPMASAGIFSALMIGLGRAVGETMIVVMATGNTPIMEWNIFTGMRTLSANIAVELPEAPVHSTHYRTLFLGAMVLFVLTFVAQHRRGTPAPAAAREIQDRLTAWHPLFKSQPTRPTRRAVCLAFRDGPGRRADHGRSACWS